MWKQKQKSDTKKFIASHIFHKQIYAILIEYARNLSAVWTSQNSNEMMIVAYWTINLNYIWLMTNHEWVWEINLDITDENIGTSLD